MYPVSAPILSIPRVRIKSTSKSYNGTETITNYMPTPHKLIRPGFETITVTSGTSNLFTLSGVPSDTMRLNRRYTYIDKITVTATPTTGEATTIEVPVNLRPDSRDQIFGEITVSNSEGDEADPTTVVNTLVITGNINYDRGQLVLNGSMTADETATSTYEFAGAQINVRFVPVDSDNGRTRVEIENSMTDIVIDVNEDGVTY